MALAGVMLSFLLGYFIYMLPSLYVEYVMEQNLKSVRRQHEAYMRSGTYEGVPVRNSAACFSLEIPAEGDRILVTGRGYSVELRVRDERLLEILDRFRKSLESGKDRGKAPGLRAGENGPAKREKRVSHSAQMWGELEELTEIFGETDGEGWRLPVEVHMLYQQDMEEEFRNESVKIHSYADNMRIFEAGVEDSANRYVNYIAMERTPESLVFTYLPVVAPEMNEIRPIVLQSLPMLGAVILLVVLLFSQVYSGGIVTPVVELVRRAEQMRRSLGGFHGERQEEKEVRAGRKGRREKRDEVCQLADTLDDFYGQIRDSLRVLEEKNRELAEENRRQEIFLRASSHQLKTPVAAALLLVDGMINEVGRYKDTKVYLPRVKEQLWSMRGIVEDILYLNHCAEHIQPRQTEPEKLLRERLSAYQVQTAEKRLDMKVTACEGLAVYTDEAILSQILDNLLSNAVKYTPAGGQIRITLRRGQEGGEIRMENQGAAIPEELLPHIFEPFVTGCHDADTAGMHSHGLGLYLASYYAGKLGMTLSVGNGENCVAAVLGLGAEAGN